MIDIRLKEFQENTVDFLYDATTYGKKERKIILHSPTGSGKTIILISYIEKMLTRFDDIVFCWISPGKGNLEEQSREKMKKFTPHLDTGDLDDILLSGFKAGTTYFINWEKITKKGNTAISQSEKENIFEKLKRARNNMLNFILIIDEEHLNNTSKAQDIITAISAEYEIRVSATPVSRAIGNYYDIDEIDVINEELITKAMYINHRLNDVKNIDISTETELLIKKADEVRKEMEQAYKEQEDNINPLVLIQFPNMNDDLITRVEEILENMGYTYKNKMVASWFSPESKEDKNSKKLGQINIGVQGKDDSITNHNAVPKFLLFKQALATGWDCPRAKILVKLRENMNESFEIQTLGRLRRMPKARHYGNDILDCSYLYTFDERYKQAVINVGAYETQKLFLKDEPKSIELIKEYRDNDTSYVDERQIRNKVYEFFKDKYKLTNEKKKNKEILANNGFIFGDKIKGNLLSGRVVTLRDIADERNFNRTETEYDVDTHIHGIELQHYIDILKKLVGLEYSRTRALFEVLFRRGAGLETYKLLNLNLTEFYAFIINNGYKLRDDLVDFDGVKYKQLQLKQYKTKKFKIPTEEYYRYVAETKNIKNLDTNVYNEYNTSMIAGKLRSISEREFEKYCEKSNKVKFLYKNGDKGMQYLSLVYTMNNGVEKHFYPDYIVVLESGETWIIETKGGEKDGKSKNIDKQVENKFGAFKRFADEHKYKFAFVRDIDGELFYNNTEYVEDMKTENWKHIKEIF